MDKKTITVIFRNAGRELLLEIPTFISGQDFIIALNETYNLGIDITDLQQCYLQSENPIALVKGNKSLDDYGLRDGTVVYYEK